MTETAQALLQEVGRRVRERRKGRSLTLKQLARSSGLSERFVGDLEAGRANISVLNLAEVARALEISIGSFFASAALEVAPAEGVVSLLGLRGAGKTSVGAALAKRLGVPFFELDRLVEAQAGMGLNELFAMHGEDYFRELELKALKQFLDDNTRAVLATGGGVVTSTEAFTLLLSRTHCVWLKTSPEEHWARVVRQGDLRPMRNRPQAMTELKRRLKEREPLYSRAQRTVVTTERPVDEIALELEQWSRGPGAHRALTSGRRQR